jgi:hypothetical protein
MQINFRVQIIQQQQQLKRLHERLIYQKHIKKTRRAKIFKSFQILFYVLYAYIFKEIIIISAAFSTASTSTAAQLTGKMK